MIAILRTLSNAQPESWPRIIVSLAIVTFVLAGMLVFLHVTRRRV